MLLMTLSPLRGGGITLLYNYDHPERQKQKQFSRVDFIPCLKLDRIK